MTIAAIVAAFGDAMILEERYDDQTKRRQLNLSIVDFHLGNSDDLMKKEEVMTLSSEAYCSS